MRTDLVVQNQEEPAARSGALPVPITLSSVQGPAPLRLLIVEDERVETRLLRDLICDIPSFACACTHVDGLPAALDHLRQRETDVVVLDLGGPDSDGLDGIGQVMEADREVAIVVLTGLMDEEVGNEAIRLGAQDYLVKGAVEGPLLVRSLRYAQERKARENEMLRAEAEFRLLSRLTRGFSTAASLDAALESLVAEVCGATGWACGESWIPAGGEVLVPGPAWAGESAAIRKFCERNRNLVIRRGEGVVGRIWETPLPVWIPDVVAEEAFVRREEARAANLRAGMLVPVLAGAEVVAVLAFYHERERREDSRLVQLVHAVATHVGGILKHRQAEDALAASERRLRQLMDTATDGILVTDPAGGIQYANGRALAMLGRSHDDVMGVRLQKLFHGKGRRLAEAQAGPEGREDGEMTEARIARPDGAEVWVIASTSPVLSDSGDFDGSLVVITDITRLKKAELSDRVLAAAGRIFASSLDAGQIVDELAKLLVPSVGDSCVVRIQIGSGVHDVAVHAPRHADGGGMAGLLETLTDLLRADERRAVPAASPGRAYLAAELDAERLRRLEATEEQRARLERLATMPALIVPLTSGGHVVGVLALETVGGARRFGESERLLGEKLGHLTSLALENARLYGEARAAIRSRDDLMGVVAHDLRSPLGAVSMYSGLLRDPSGEDSREKWTTGITRSVEYMDRLIQDLLDATRLETGQIRLERSRVDVGSLTDEIIAMFDSVATGAGVRLESAVAPGLPEIWADPRRMLQVMSNLVGNALKFTPAGGVVTIEARETGGAVELAVRDTGSGIPPDQLPFVFNRFWQGPGEKRGGVGLGLAIVRGLIEAHGGAITVESEVGRGSVFRFALEIASDQARSGDGAPKVISAEARKRAFSRPPIRVVIADDHRMFLSSLKEVLTRSGWIDVVAAVTSGEQAVERARTLLPDLVLMDLEMAGIGGLAAIRQIAAFPTPIPVVALTAEADEASLFQAIDAGVSGFLHKSTEPDRLLETIDAVMDGGAGLTAESQRSVLAEFLLKRSQAPLKDLTDQERAIVTLVASGYNSAEIGRQLYLAPSTVDTYRSKLMRRLGLRDRAELVHFALRAGLLKR